MVNTKKIAFIDDELSIHQIFKVGFRKEIKSKEIEFHHFYNGEECYDFLKENPETKFIFILTDINMPKMNGFTLLEKVKAEFSEIDVYMCSAYDSKDHVEKAMSLGASGYFPKPLNFQKLRDIVNEKS
jgi:YesN/AraC family two-component response regulator